MKKLSYAIYALAFGALLSGVISSCKKKDDNPVVPPTGNRSIVDIVSADSRFTVLKAAVVKAGLAQTLSGTGPFTVFAPTDDAFAAAGVNASTIEGLDANSIKAILLYHVVTGANPASSFPASTAAAPNKPLVTVATKKLYVSSIGGSVFVNGSSKVVVADVAATNGVIHAIDKVLNPQGFASIVAAAQSNENFSFLVAAVTKCGLAQTLSAAGNFTVFAPTNDAFKAAGFATVDAINNADAATVAALTDILKYHVIANRYFSSDLGFALGNNGVATLLTGKNVIITTDGGAKVKGIGNTAAAIIGPLTPAATLGFTGVDFATDNGVVHVIDQVLIPTARAVSNTITDLVVNDSRFTLLKAAVVKAGLASVLSGAGPFTVFAPTDAAFTAAGITQDVINSLPADKIADILKYHVISGSNPASSFPASTVSAPNKSLQTVKGTNLYVSVEAGTVSVNGSSKVVVADVNASNGVVHAIDKVLNPQGFTSIVTAAQAYPSLSRLVAAVIRCNLAGTLSDASAKFTVFAPTNDAFAAAGFPDDASINNAPVDVLTNILTYHVLGNRYFSSDLTLAPASGVATVNGQSVVITLTDGAKVKGAGNNNPSNIGPLTAVNPLGITGVDIATDNGVVHVIDQVLLPASDH